MSAELELDEVRAGYGSVEVLHGLSLAVPPLAVTALLGRNGAGKTTTLAAMAGLVPVRSGRLCWAGEDVTSWPVRARAEAGMLLVPEQRAIFASLSVADNLDAFARGPQEQSRREEALGAFPVLRDRLTQPAGSLSGGEQQMLAMCRVLLQAPRLLLLDEVSFGLAPRVADQIFDVVAELARRCTVVLVEQYVGEALRLADVVYVLDRGTVAFAGEPGELASGRLPEAGTG